MFESQEWSDDFEDGDDCLLGGALEDTEVLQRGFDFALTPHVDRRIRRFGLRHRNYTARLVQRGGGADSSITLDVNQRPVLPRQIEEALQRAINEQILPDEQVSPDDHLLININSNRLRGAYHSRRLRVRDWMESTLAARTMLERLSRVLNSNEQFRMDDTFSLNISHIRDPGTGSGRVKLGTQCSDKVFAKKKSVIEIKNKDELCCARALVTAKAYRDLGSRDSTYDSLRRGLPIQERQAKELHRLAGVPEGPCGLPEIEKFQTYLADYQIVVVSKELAYQIIFKGPEQPEEKLLVLIKTGEHFNACNSLKAFFNKNYYCLKCEKGFDHNDRHHHSCRGKKCFACHQSSCPDFKASDGEKATVPCPQCGRKFFGTMCFALHKDYQSEDGKKAIAKKKNSVCHTVKKCQECGKSLTPWEISHKHVCGYSECPSCKVYLNLHQHQCYIQNPNELKEKRKRRKRKADGSSAQEQQDPPIFVTWDTEARQENGIHVPNLICAMTSNSDEQFSFEGESCVTDFLDWLREIAEDNKVIAIAHNFRAYDAYFVLEELYKQNIIPEQVVNGAKILSMRLPGDKIEFKDSMCFLQMPLSNFPKAFGLTEQRKGFFPHFMNTVDNQSYVGPMPARDYYDPEGMSTSRKAEFEKWYADRVAEDYQFDFKHELLAYCQSDVKLLQEGCEVFREEFQAVAGFDPMEKCLTIASACNLYYRTVCMTNNTLGSEPVRGWHGKGKTHSHAAMEWLYYLNHELRSDNVTDTDRIAHARNHGEHTIRVGTRQIHVDGIDERANIVYEFNGCYYHGCPVCFPNRDKRHAKLDDRTMRDVYEDTQTRADLIRRAGYELVEMWECQWNRLKKENESIRSFVQSLDLVTRLEPREAFYGGRTNAVKLHHVTEDDEHIHYVDFTSLYPWVNKNCVYPMGHPVILSEPGHTDLSQFFGLVKCRVLPPYELYHPVLPYRSGGKLTFPLCRSCVETEQSKPLTERSSCCAHTPEERALTGTWCTPEIEEAVKQGYVIQHVHEVWHFERRSSHLFTSYVNTFLKMKQEASGWPAWVGEDVGKRVQYITQYEQKEGIRLDPDKIEKNPGRRSLAKMMLNSFWGKYGQQGNKHQVEAFTSPAEFYQLLNDDSKQIHDIRVVNDEMLEVVHNNVEEWDPVQVNINIFIACLTTCWARLKLYREGLLQLQPEQTLYFDTDSIIYTAKPGQPVLPLGDFLGEFTDELGEGDHIVEFASAGPKNYGYRTATGKVECKVRGFSLNTRGSRQLNFDILKQNVIDEVTIPLEEERRQIPVFNPHKITRDVRTKQLTTETEIKRYQVVCDKRVIDPKTFLTYPYGYHAWS